MAHPRRSLWQRIKTGVRHVWRGEAVGDADPGYLVSPYDLFDGVKGIEHSFWGMLAAWRRRPSGQNGQPRSQTLSDANVRDLARLLERYNPFAQAIFTALRS